MNNLSRLDLNLLLTLDALLTEQNVTRAAARLHLSQPSVSVQLAKLREALGDPLLLPGPRGMRPTARAEALREPLRQALQALDNAIASPLPFEPAQAHITWRIAASDYSEHSVLLPALAKLRHDAPHCRLALMEVPSTRLGAAMEHDKLDLAIFTRSGAPLDLRSRLLFKENYRLVCRRDHPELQQPPDLTQFCQLEHVIVSPDGGGFVGSTDEALAALGLTRKVVMSVPHFSFVSAVLSRTNMVALLPERLVRDDPALKILDAPIEITGFDKMMLWPERVHRDPAHQWLRELIARAVAAE
ncbi:LysR family transcriptional regulator [Atlantibacter hermannii]|uniref:LysR family transcriptional regulator n=1 Tax=Atlantibacter hermannii TaxID=565 RepID=UPI0028B21F1D|nr:LysR family transcriptional regulator [Atlantibacter hermannii]